MSERSSRKLLELNGWVNSDGSPDNFVEPVDGLNQFRDYELVRDVEREKEKEIELHG